MAGEFILFYCKLYLKGAGFPVADGSQGLRWLKAWTCTYPIAFWWKLTHRYCCWNYHFNMPCPGSPVLRVEHRTSLKLKREVFEIVLFGAYSFERYDGGGWLKATWEWLWRDWG